MTKNKAAAGFGTRQTFAVILISALCFFVAAGQTPDALRRAEAVYAEAVKLAETDTAESLENALPKFAEAKRLFSEINNDERVADAEFYLGLVAQTLGNKFLNREEYERAKDYFSRALPIFQAIEYRTGEAEIFHNLGYIADRQNAPEKAQEFFGQALEAYGAAENAGGAAAMLRNLALIYEREKNYERAAKFFGQALEIRKQAGNRPDEAILLKDLGDLYEITKNDEKAAFYFAQALPIYRELNDHYAAGIVLNSLGFAANRQSKYREAIEFYAQASAANRTAKNAPGEAMSERNIGAISYELKDFRRAGRHFENALALKKQLGDRAGEAVLLADLGDTFSSEKNYRKAVAFYDSSLAIYRELPDRAGILDGLNKLAANYAESFRPLEAAALYEEVLAIYQADKNANGEAATLVSLSRSHSVLKNYATAEAYNTRAAEMFGELKDEENEAYALLNLGALYAAQHENERAKTTFERALTIFRRLKNRRGIGLTLISIADVNSYLNEHVEAIRRIGEAQEIFRAEKEPAGEYAAHFTLGTIRYALSEYDESLKASGRALKIAGETNDLNRQANVLVNLALVYSALGQYRKSFEIYEKVLAITGETGDRFTESIALNNVGYDYFKQKDYEKAKKYLVQSIEILRAQKARREEAYALHNLGLAFYKLKDYAEAVKLYDQALAIYLEVKDRRPESFLYDSYGEVYRDLGQFDRAAANLEKSLILAREIKYSNVEASALANLMILWERRGQPKLAAFYGKQAVNVYQTIRGDNRNLDEDAQKSFLKSNEETYRRLADLLIAQGRLIEAQQILDMLKEEEFYGFVRRDQSEIERLSQRADLTADETAALARYKSNAARVAAIGFEFGKLQDAVNTLPAGESLAAADQKRYAELAKQLEDASAAFQIFLRGLAEEFAKKPKVVEEIQENAGLQADLKSWGSGVVALYTVAGADRYRVILTTPDAQIDGKTEIKVEDLNRKISEFRQAVQNPNVDPRPLGKELYDILIKPIEKQLAGARAKTLLWSLDGTLRYLPLAALWDGERYFGQKYENVVITLASRTRLGETVSQDWRVLGLGVTNAQAVTEPNGTERINFAALPAVGNELRAIVSDETVRGNDGGVLPGVILLNENFTENALKERLGKGYKVVHIASHFSFRPGNETKSFLLLGDGSALSLVKVRTSPQLKFKGVELLTLSACQTAVGETDATGKEIESFGEIAQQNGAKAVLATLWSVADESTQVLIGEFYRLRKENANLTKSEAMQRAQQAMIEGKLQSSAEAVKKRAELVGASGANKNLPVFTKDAKKPFAHPFYWSPFVLIGNWR